MSPATSNHSLTHAATLAQIRFPSPEPEDQTTPRLSNTPLPQLDDSDPNSNFYSIDHNTQFATSTESFETIINASVDSLSNSSFHSIGGSTQFATSTESFETIINGSVDSLSNSSSYSIGRSTQFASSTESFQTIVNASLVSLPTRAAADNPPQSVDDRVDLLGETPPHVDLPPELSYSSPNFSTPSISGSSFMLIPSGSLETLSMDTPS